MSQRPVFTVTMPNGMQHDVEADSSAHAEECISDLFGVPTYNLRSQPFRAGIIAPPKNRSSGDSDTAGAGN